MQLFTYIAIYFVLWWTSLFIVMPFGSNSQVETGVVVVGTEPSAPIKTYMWQKLLATSVIAGILMVLMLWALSSEWLIDYWG